MGAAVNPVNIRWSPAEIAYSLADSDTRVLFVDDAFAPMIPTLQEQFPELTTRRSTAATASRPPARWATRH